MIYINVSCFYVEPNLLSYNYRIRGILVVYTGDTHTHTYKFTLPIEFVYSLELKLYRCISITHAWINEFLLCVCYKI